MLPSTLDVPSAQNTTSYSGTHLLQEVLSDTQPHPHKQHQAPPLGSHSSLRLCIPALSIHLARLSLSLVALGPSGRGLGKAPGHHRIPSITQHRAGSRAGFGGVPGAVDRINSEQVLPGPPSAELPGSCGRGFLLAAPWHSLHYTQPSACLPAPASHTP